MVCEKCGYDADIVDKRVNDAVEEKNKRITLLNSQFQKRLSSCKDNCEKFKQRNVELKTLIIKHNDLLSDLIEKGVITVGDVKEFISKKGTIAPYKKTLAKLSQKVEGQKKYITQLEDKLKIKKTETKSGITIIGVKVVGICSKCRKGGDDIPKNKNGDIVPDKDISCVNGALGESNCSGDGQ